MAWIIIIVIAWFIFGFLAFGLEKGHWEACRENHIKFLCRESDAWTMFICGPFGLITELIIYYCQEEPFHFSLKSPRKTT